MGRYQRDYRRWPFALVVGALLVLGFLIVALPMMKPAKDRDSGAVWNRMKVQTTLTYIQMFHSVFNEWPTNLSQLVSKDNSQQLQFLQSRGILDQWGRPMLFEAPTKNRPGRLGSYGFDGEVGGEKVNADFFLKVGE